MLGLLVIVVGPLGGGGGAMVKDPSYTGLSKSNVKYEFNVGKYDNSDNENRLLHPIDSADDNTNNNRGRWYYDYLNSLSPDRSWNLTKFVSTTNNTTMAMESASESATIAISGGAVGVNSIKGVVYLVGLRVYGGYRIELPVIITVYNT